MGTGPCCIAMRMLVTGAPPFAAARRSISGGRENA